VKVWIYKGDIERGKMIDFRSTTGSSSRAERARRPAARPQAPKEGRNVADA
jgi:hypothetical protein